MYSVSKHIRSQLESLSRKERMIADYILEKREEFLTASIAENANKIGVSQASITKFSKKMGLKGLRSLKVELAKEHDTEEHELHTKTLSSGDTIKDVMDKVLNNSVSALYSTHKTVDYDEIEKAADVLAASEEIVLYGAGSSRILAEDLFLKLTKIGLRTVTPLDHYGLLAKIPNLEGSAVVVLFSKSGRTKEVIEALKLCRDQGVKTIFFTQSIHSPARNAADIVLSASLEENNVSIGTLTARLSQLFLVDVLFMRTAVKSGRDIFEEIDTAEEAVQD